MTSFLRASVRFLAVAIALGGALVGHSANAKPHTLPEPYMSRALEALVMPVEPSVRSLFKLGPKEQGMLVLAVKPGGTAARQGIQAGDVIGHVKGRGIKKPSELDAIFYYFLKQAGSAPQKGGTSRQSGSGFPIAYSRGGKQAVNHYRLDLPQYQTVLDPGSVGSWTSSPSFASSFSFQEFVLEFTIELASSYANSQSQIDQLVSSQTFASEFRADLLDTDGDGINDAADNDDDNDGIVDANDRDEDGDGILDAAESFQDNDEDGIDDAHDNDDDNDGVDDAHDADHDTDHDGIPDARDNDDDNDGVADAQDTEQDEDRDGVEDAYDTDDDNDGLSDASDPDHDADHDGVVDARDNDDDNDGVDDAQEVDGDADHDGVEDAHDHDDDNDGVDDAQDADHDTDHDGVDDAHDNDDDNDGVADAEDADEDGDGVDDAAE